MSPQEQVQDSDTNELQTWKRVRTAREVGEFLTRHFDRLAELSADEEQDFSDIDKLAA